MRRVIPLIFAVVAGIPSLSLAELTTKMVKNPDGSIARIYYDNEKEVAREVQEPGSLMKMTGKVPDGVFREYHPNGEKRERPLTA